MRKRAASALLGWGLLVTATTPQGCGSSFSTSDAGAVDGGGADGPTEGQAAEAGCVVPPNGVGSEGDFCNWFAAYLGGCGHCEQCAQLDANECVKLGDTLSVPFKQALMACSSQLSCTDLTSLPNDPCIRQHLAQAQPAMAAQSVETAYCNACKIANPAGCSSFFDFSPDAGSNAGIGIWAMVFSDTLDGQLASQCGDITHCGAGAYALCADIALCGVAPHGNCPHGLCD